MKSSEVESSTSPCTSTVSKHNIMNAWPLSFFPIEVSRFVNNHRSARSTPCHDDDEDVENDDYEYSDSRTGDDDEDFDNNNNFSNNNK